MSDIFDLTALELGAAIRQGEVSPTQAARAALDRMERTLTEDPAPGAKEEQP